MKLFISVLFFVSTLAYADLTGSWLGEGTIIFSDTMESQCELMEFNVSQTADKFTLEDGTMLCNGFEQMFEPVRLSIKDETLWLDEKQVGSITDTQAKITFKVNDDFTIVYELNLIAPEKMTYQEHIVTDDGSIKIAGVLNLIPR